MALASHPRVDGDGIHVSGLISVILPVRDGARWLSRSIASVLDQSHGDIELLAIDDGSADVSWDMLTTYSNRDRRIRAIHQPKSGLVTALNRGVAEARGAFIARHDADDEANARRLELQLQYLSAHPKIGLLGTWAEERDEYDNRLGVRRPETDPGRLAELLLRRNPFVHSSVMLPTAIVRRLGGYRAVFEGAEDYDLWLRIAEISQVANIPEILVKYRVHAQSVSHSRALRQSFSVRLAQTSAAARRGNAVDPADRLQDPPDWHTSNAEGSFFAYWASIYRLIDPTCPPDRQVRHSDISWLAEQFHTLDRQEREFAILAIMDFIRRTPRARQLLIPVLRRRPGAGLRMIWQLVRDR
jgi:glycosyltransferase involved in cell wall biosynthesis